MGSESKFYQIPFAEIGYMVNQEGRFKSPYKEVPMRTSGDYIGVTVKTNGRSTTMPLHRVVAITFIPNPENKRLVNHINRERWDCRVANLEWATHSENTKHWQLDEIKKQLTFKIGTSVLIPRIGKTGIVCACMGRYIDVIFDNNPYSVEMFIYTELQIV